MRRKADIESLRIPLAMTAIQVVVVTIMSLVFPGISAGNIAFLCGGGAVVAFLSQKARFGTGLTDVAIPAFTSLLTAGVILNTWYFTTYAGGTLEWPVLVNVDAYRYFDDAVWHTGNGGWAAHPAHGFYGTIVGAVFTLFGQSIANALIFNSTMIVISLFLIGSTTFRLLDRRDAGIAVVATGAVCYWLSIGTLLLKDATVIVAMMMTARGLTGESRKDYGYVAAGIAIMALVRTNLIPAQLVGVAFVPGLRRDFGRRGFLVAFGAVCWGAVTIARYSPSIVGIMSGGDATGVVYNAPNQLAYYNMIGDWADKPWSERLALTPVAAMVQYLIPFPWNYLRDTIYGPTQLWSHIGYPGYAFGAVVLFYLATVGRGLWESRLGRMTAWGVMCWLIPCYLFGGTISRYGLPAVGVMAPAVAYTLVGFGQRRCFWIYGGIYATVLGIVLFVCHHLQIAASL